MKEYMSDYKKKSPNNNGLFFLCISLLNLLLGSVYFINYFL